LNEIWKGFEKSPTIENIRVWKREDGEVEKTISK